MNIFQTIWTYLVWAPQINLLKLGYSLTGDTGIAIVFMACVVNIPLWLLYGKSYITMQKQKVLAPQITEIRSKYKETPVEMQKAMGEFSKKHNLDMSGTFQMIFFQIFFVTGLFGVVNVIEKGEATNYLYSWAWGSDIFTFPTKILGGAFDLHDSVHNQAWIVLLTSFLSYIYGMYTFKWSPQIKVAPPKDQTEEQKIQMEAMERSQNFVGIYLNSILFLFINFNLPLGLNIYSLTASVLSLLRQIVITQYYANHTRELISQIQESDPDKTANYTMDTSENILENTVDISDKSEQILDVEAIKVEIKTNPKNKTSKKLKKKK